MMLDYRVFIQARMESQRFPGKVLAPLNGKPIIYHVVKAIEAHVPRERIVLVTGNTWANDPLIQYCEEFLSIQTFPGNLRNVFFRYQKALKRYPCGWVFRVCGDSPFFPGTLITEFLETLERREQKEQRIDVMTNVWPSRTYPKGHSLELFRAAHFSAEPEDWDEREHIGPYFYRRSDQFSILSIRHDQSQHDEQYCVDTVEDLHRLESLFSPEEASCQTTPYRTLPSLLKSAPTTVAR